MNRCRLFALILVSSSLFAQMSGPVPPFTGISHIGIYVNDIDTAHAFYAVLLGFDEPFSLTRDDGSVAIAFVKVNNSQYLELLAESCREDGRFSHFAVRTDSVTLARNYLVSRGVKLVKEIHTGKSGDRFFTVKDPDDHFIEFVQYAQNGWLERSKRGPQVGPVSRHIVNVGITVRSVDAALKFYRDILGLRLAFRDGGFHDQAQWFYLQFPNQKEYVVLMPYVEGSQKPLNHVDLEVSDVKNVVTALQLRAGSQTSLREIDVEIGDNENLKARLVDPDGMPIDLVTPLKIVDVSRVKGHSAGPDAPKP